MIRRTGLKSVLFALSLAALAFHSCPAYAFEPYPGYTYDPNGRSVQSINGYEPVRNVTSNEIGTTPMKNPKDLFASIKLGKIYILDSGNGRIIILNEDYQLIKTIDKFTDENGETKLNGPSSIFVADSGDIYISDTMNSRVVKMDDTGLISRIYKKPQTDLYPANVAFEPIKTVVDESGNLYILVKGVYQGALVLTKDGEFSRFYASKKISPSLQLIQDLFWKRFMTQAQKDALSDYVPTEFSSFDIDRKGFIYTVTQDKEIKKTLEKYNSLGKSVVMNNSAFGDLEAVYDKILITTQFIDVNVEDNYFVDALDLTRGRIFRYDNDFNLLFVFGGLGGAQTGTFKTPIAVDDFNGEILVLDYDLGSITVFAPTDFGRKVNSAIALYNNGDYLEAVQPWQEVIQLNENYSLSYKGIGDGLFMTGQYKEAMRNYRLANDKQSYLRAFREYRNILIKQYFPLFALFIALLLVFPIVRKAANSRKRGNNR